MEKGDKQLPYDIADVHPPRGLFRKIIRRLGLEKDLQMVTEHIKFFTWIIGIFIFLSIFAFIGLKEVLTESSFGPFLSLIISDPGIVLEYWQTFMFSIFETMPVGYATIFLTLFALILLFAKLAGTYVEKSLIISKSINKNKNG